MRRLRNNIESYGQWWFHCCMIEAQGFSVCRRKQHKPFPFFSYSCFDKGCPVIALKRMRQCRLVLWVVKVYHCLIEVPCVKPDGRTHVSVFSLVLVLIEQDTSNTQDSVQPHFQHLEVRQKYDAVHLIFYSLFSVRKPGQPRSFVFDLFCSCTLHLSCNIYLLSLILTRLTHKV